MAAHLIHFSILFETADDHEQIFGKKLQCPSGFRRLDRGKCRGFLLVQIALAQFLFQLIETGASRTVALQVVQEFLNGVDKQSDPS